MARKSHDESEAPKAKSHLIPMTKDGETILVHPSCVKSHELLGWNVAG